MAISLLMLFPCRLPLHVSAYFWWLWSCYMLIIGMTFLSRIQMWHCTFSSDVPVLLTCSVCLYLHFFLEEMADFKFLCLFICYFKVKFLCFCFFFSSSQISFYHYSVPITCSQKEFHSIFSRLFLSVKGNETF